MFAKNCWYVAAEVEQVTNKEPFGTVIAGENIVLYRDTKNNVIAMSDLCPHRLAPMSVGQIEGDEIRCMYHGIKFDSDGVCNEIPGQDNIPKTFCIAKYAVKEFHEWIWIWIGDQEKADESLLPNISFHDPANFNVKKNQLEMNGNYELMNDNTCDLSHVAFVHRNTFKKVGDEDWAEKKPVTTLLERGVQVDRWIVNMTHPGLQKKVDFRSSFRHMMPGIFTMALTCHPVGTAEQSDFGDPFEGAEEIYQSSTIQAMIPIDENKMRFYYSICCPHYVPIEALEFEFAFAESGFVEDKEMIEHQHRMITSNPGVRLGKTSHDLAGSHLRKVIIASNKE